MSMDRTPNAERVLVPRKHSRPKNFPKETIAVLKQWITVHWENPYPSKEERNALITYTGLTPRQLGVWFVNARKVIHRVVILPLEDGRLPES